MRILLVVITLFTSLISLSQPILDKQKMLDRFDFWNNQDWEWYKENIPFLETPDAEIDKTYYYRWELITLHLVYGAPEDGYSVTEFIDRPWWSGSYGAISCPVGHQLYDFRWFRTNRYLEDYITYWYRTPGAQLQNYTNWMGDAVWQAYKVKQDYKFTTNLLNDMKYSYSRWADKFYVEEEGMFAWDGMHDGMETNINSRQTPNWFAGAPGYRPTINSYLWAEAKAIANIAALKKDEKTVSEFSKNAAIIKDNLQQKNWDPNRNFFFHRFKNDEVTVDKTDTIKANTLTYESGKYAGNPHGRELIGYVPWYFNLPDDDKGFETAWQYLMDPEYFYADFGPTVVERNDPLFRISPNCCVWSGNSWPFATSQTLKAMANVINNYDQKYVSSDDYFQLLKIFTMTQRKDGKPYIAEALHPDTGSWDGHDHTGHSEHYYHSSYIDLIINDLIGLKPQASDSIVLEPLVPEEWDYFCLDDVMYHGNRISILWDRDGSKYGKGAGFQLIANDQVIAASDIPGPISAYLPPIKAEVTPIPPVNYAVNNSNHTFPEAIASFPGIFHSKTQLNDGQYWYLTPTTNQWSTMYSEAKQDWAGIDFGIERKIDSVAIYFVQDDSLIKSPKSFQLQYWAGDDWKQVENASFSAEKPIANTANWVYFNSLSTSKIRVLLTPTGSYEVAISELEAWGAPDFPLSDPPDLPSQNIAMSAQAEASYTSRFDKVATINDGIINPQGRWTAFESPNSMDWVTLSFDTPVTFNSLHLYFFEDNNIKSPKDYRLLYWKNNGWQTVKVIRQVPENPTGNALNIMNFKEISTSKIKVELDHKEGKYTGIYELQLYDAD